VHILGGENEHCTIKSDTTRVLIRYRAMVSEMISLPHVEDVVEGDLSLNKRRRLICLKWEKYGGVNVYFFVCLMENA
jgi:hypothetical protein